MSPHDRHQSRGIPGNLDAALVMALMPELFGRPIARGREEIMRLVESGRVPPDKAADIARIVAQSEGDSLMLMQRPGGGFGICEVTGAPVNGGFSIGDD